MQNSKWIRRIAKATLVVGMLGAVWGYLAQATAPPRPARLLPTAEDSGALQATVAAVDQEFSRLWQEHQVQPATAASWETVCRRLSLALVGSGLSLEELRALESMPEGQRVNTHLENLLIDERFHAYWAERWARAYVGHEEGPFIVYRRRRFVNWLSEQLQMNRPYDQIVQSLITAKGFWTDQPAVNFITKTLQGGMEEGQPDPIKLAARTSRAVLGTRIDCLQCHDDFLGNVSLGDEGARHSGTQRDFHALAAFYAPLRINPLQGIRDEERTYKYQFLHAEEETEVAPQVPFARDLLPETGKPRERLAAWATHPDNRPAMRAAVGRVWALMFGKPLTGSVDDIPLFEPIPPAIDALADDFRQNGFDLRRLIRVIARTQVFNLESQAPEGATADTESLWAVFPLVPLRPEQVASSVIQACRLTTLDRDSSFFLQLQAFGQGNDFIKRYGDTGEDEFKQDSITITQRLLVMNGEFVSERIKDDPVFNASAQIGMFASKPEDAIDVAYLAILNRHPRDTERQRFLERLADNASRRQVVEDLYWVLLNSTEFAWNH